MLFSACYHAPLLTLYVPRSHAQGVACFGARNQIESDLQSHLVMDCGGRPVSIYQVVSGSACCKLSVFAQLICAIIPVPWQGKGHGECIKPAYSVGFLGIGIWK